MNYAILGGTFNPPHLGHDYIINTLGAKYDKVIVIPTNEPPHKRLVTGGANAAQRYEMALLAFHACFVSDMEIERGGVC